MIVSFSLFFSLFPFLSHCNRLLHLRRRNTQTPNTQHMNTVLYTMLQTHTGCWDPVGYDCPESHCTWNKDLSVSMRNGSSSSRFCCCRGRECNRRLRPMDSRSLLRYETSHPHDDDGQGHRNAIPAAAAAGAGAGESERSSRKQTMRKGGKKDAWLHLFFSQDESNFGKETSVRDERDMHADTASAGKDRKRRGK